MTDEEQLPDEAEPLLDEDDQATDAAAAEAPAVAAGPWDAADEPDDGIARLDLGGLRMPVFEGMELRVEVDQAQQQVVAATLVDGHSMMQVNAFAAPKSTGIWGEVRDEIAESVRAGGGEAHVADGPFGSEVRGRVPAEVPGQGVVLQPARFVGVDGPRWFLRGLLTGPAATDPTQAHRLEEALRHVVVVRGTEAMAPRDPLPLTLPKEAVEAANLEGGAAGEEAGEGRYSELDPFNRGPEITEVR